MKKIPWVIAHRGASKHAPENTRPAFDLALSYTIDGLETDVQLTKDGIPVLYHDPTLLKVMKKRKRVADVTYRQLCKLDFGKWYNPKFGNEPVLTLREMLASYNHRTRLMLEIKSPKADHSFQKSSELTLKVLQELQKPEIKKYRDKIFILSFDPAVLKLAHKTMPELKYVLNLSDKAYDLTGYISIIYKDPSKLHHLFALCVSIKNLSKNLTGFAHRYHKKMMTYVCNDSRQVRRAMECNADVIMTDDPGWLTKHLNVTRLCKKACAQL